MNALQLTMTYIVNRGFSVADGKDTDQQTACEDPDLVQCSVEVVDEAAKQRLRVKEELYNAYRGCHFENVAKRFIKPDLGDIGQQVCGAGIGDLQTQGFENERWCFSWGGTCVDSRKDCAALQTQKPSVSKTCTFLDLTTQTDVPDRAWEEEVTGGDPRSTRDPKSSSNSSFWLRQSDATSRLGPDLVPPTGPELMMKCQCKNPKRHMFLLHTLR